MGVVGQAMREQQHDAHHGVGDGADHERAAECGADADVTPLGATEQHGDQGDHTLRQGRAGGGQDGADRQRSDLQPDSKPLHGVDEPLAGEVDHHGAAEQQSHVDHGGVPSADRGRERLLRGDLDPR